MNVLNFDSKLCERTRRQLDAYLSNELLVETTSEVVRHLEGCKECSAELESRTRVREALQKAAARQLPPEHLSRVVHQRLMSAQSERFWRLRSGASWTLALAAMALMAVVAQQGLRLYRDRQLVASVLTLGVADHLHCAIRAHNYPEVANSTDQLRQKLGPQYAGLLPVVEENLSGFQVLEAHICSVPGVPRKYVHFIARGQGTILSVILTKRRGESFPAGPAGSLLAARASGGVDLYRARLQGFSVAGFESDECFGFVVCDLGEDNVLRIATALGPALRTALESQASGPTLRRTSRSLAVRNENDANLD